MSEGGPASLSAVEAGSVLGLPPDVVRVLADAGYLVPSSLRGGVPRFALGDLKAFQARTATGGDEPEEWDADGFDPDAVLGLLDGRVEEMAERSLFLLRNVMPESRDWSQRRRDRFVADASERIRAILAVCAHGPGGPDEDAVSRDLADIGADAAHHGVPLPVMLVALRTSRDLMVQSAVEVAEERGRQWGLALAVALTRVIPAIDRLSDAVARGYWDAVLEIEAEGLDRLRTLVDRVTDGVFSADADGVVRYVNPALVELVGRSADGLVGRPLVEVLGVEPGVDGVVDGRDIRQFERLRDGVVVGWDGLVRIELR
jgi:PAS domain-containing protein